MPRTAIVVYRLEARDGKRKMKCPRCGAETSKQRYCIYCGERLSSRSAIKVQRAPSGVMRIRYRGSISQTSLPEVQKRNSGLQEMNLASLSSSQNIGKVSRQDDEFAMEVIGMKDNQESSARESRELQAMLNRLNSSAAKSVEKSPIDMPVKSVKSSKSESIAESHVSEVMKKDSSLSDIDMSSTSLDNLNLNLCSDDDLDDLNVDSEYEEHDSFFELDNSGEQDVSGTIPMPSGSFAKTPSGGFHLIVDEIKSVCSGMVSRIKSLRRSKPDTNVVQREGRFDDSVNRQKLFKYLTLGAILAAIVIIIAAVALNEKTPAPEPEIAAVQNTPVAGNEDFAILPLDDDIDEELDFSDLTFDEDFSIPELDGDAAAADVQEKVPEAPKAQAKKEEEAVGSARLTELRLYEHKDNVLAVVSDGESYKTKRGCVIRKGPASRFDLVKQIGSGTKIQVLTTVDEDWVLVSGSVWKKSGHTDRLGPGDQFAEALKGMKIPQPKGRVISAKNWKYIKAGEIYGYVGPACFK